MDGARGEFVGYFDGGPDDPITYFEEPMPLGTVKVNGEEFEGVRVTAYAKRADGAIGMLIEMDDPAQHERLKQLIAEQSQ
jgi:hypothetical protein